MHYGYDIGYPYGTPVVAAFDGVVRLSKANAGGFGELVVIRHHNKLETYYGHLSKRLVNPGQMVKSGDTIALGGSTGRSTGNHLHFETRYLGIPFNPSKIIDFEKYTLIVDTLYTNRSADVVALTTKPTNSTTQSSGNINSSTSSSANTSPKPAVSYTSNKGGVYYKVKNGDTLSQIAQKYHTSVAAIKKLNGLKSDFLSLGKTLRVK
jgi:murein DD-endopeptidase MepM/ murein hydrolase activator NlpD